MSELKKLLLVLIVVSVIIPLQSLNAQNETDKITNRDTLTTKGLTALEVIHKFVDVTGGSEKYLGIHDRTTITTGNMMGKEFSVTIQQKAPNKLRQEIHVGPAVQTLIFDGTKGVMIMGDNTSDLQDKELSQIKLEAQMNFLLDPEACGVTPRLLGIETVDSMKCYKISIANDSSAMWIQYYDINSGLKIKEIRDIETPQEKFKEESIYSDYKDVEGIKYPFKIKQTLGMQSVEINVDSISVNTSLDHKLFEIPE